MARPQADLAVNESFASDSASSPTSLGTDRGLRGFIHQLDSIGKLVRIAEAVDWKFEIGRRTRASRLPLLFEAIRDYPGQQVFTNGLSDRESIGLALGFDPGTSLKTIVSECRERLRKPIPPRFVPLPSLLKNVAAGPEVDLTSFAVPHWSELETARYIGTWHINVSRDQETGQSNVGVYRMQILNPTQATISASAGSDLMLHLAKAELEGESLPAVVAIGVPEAVVMAGGASCPPGMNEFELAGALRQEPVEVFIGPATGLEVPASSEIVIEGSITPNVRVQDGPYFDYCGIPNTNPNAVLFEASRVISRNNPIFRGSAIGMPGAEDHQLFAFLAQLNLVDFHGSRIKQQLQNFLWKHQYFRALQWSGRVAGQLKKLRS
jgi:UbiD family decarboxylase